MTREELIEVFAGNIKRQRKLLHLTQVDVAQRAGITQAYLSALESGTAQPALGTLAPLAGALETTPSSLLDAQLYFLARRPELQQHAAS